MVSGIKSWATRCVEMDPSTRSSHPGDDSARRRGERGSDEIDRMQREFRLSLLARKAVRV